MCNNKNYIKQVIFTTFYKTFTNKYICVKHSHVFSYIIIREDWDFARIYIVKKYSSIIPLSDHLYRDLAEKIKAAIASGKRGGS